MKLTLADATPERCCAAALRNCLSCDYVPLACPVRQCRRSRVCAGPLITEAEDGRRRLARADAADVAPGRRLAPLCYLLVDEDVKARVDTAYRATLRALEADPRHVVLETTRVLAARRWRRLQGLDG
jgi:hypothetical protein